MASLFGSLARVARGATALSMPTLRTCVATTASRAMRVSVPEGSQQSPALQAIFTESFSTKTSKKSKKGTAAATNVADEQEGSDAPAFNVEETSALMEKALTHLQHELAGLRTGRATTGMLDHIKAEVYNEHLSLKTLGMTVVRDPQLLVYTVFDPDSVPQIEKAIRESPLELNPKVAGSEIQIPVPRPTIESLNAMKKVCRTEAETAKVTIRHARKLAMAAVKAITAEDIRFKLGKDVQKLTDDYIARVEEIEKAKEKSIQDHST